MEQNINSNKISGRPSHESIDTKLRDGKLAERTDQERMDQTAMKAAKRAQNRISGNEQRVPGETMFTK